MGNRWTKIDSSAEWKWDLNKWHVWKICIRDIHRHIHIHKTDNIPPIRQKPWMKTWAHLSQLAPLKQMNENHLNNAQTMPFDRVRFIVCKPYVLSVFLLPKMFNTISHFDSRTRATDQFSQFYHYLTKCRMVYLPHNGRCYFFCGILFLFRLNGNGNEKKKTPNKTLKSSKFQGNR